MKLNTRSQVVRTVSLGATLLVLCAVDASASDSGVSAEGAFTRLASLAGAWHGVAQTLFSLTTAPRATNHRCNSTLRVAVARI